MMHTVFNQSGAIVSQQEIPDPDPTPGDELHATIEQLREQVTDLQDQATGKITKAQLSAKLASVDAPTKGVI